MPTGRNQTSKSKYFRMKIIYQSISFLLVLTVALMLVGSVATIYINPSTLHVLAFASFLSPVLWVLNLVIFTWLVFRGKLLLIVPLIALAITWQNWSNTFQIKGNTTSDTATLDMPVKIMSYNTRMFDYYKHSGLPGAPGKIFDFINSKEPDIICFQEYFTSHRRDGYSPRAIAAKLRNYNYRQVEYLRRQPGGTGYGMATFSKHPIINGGTIQFENSLNLVIYSDININGTVVRVYNVHLESIGFQEDDLNLLDSLDLTISERDRAGLRNIGQKLMRAIGPRAEQAKILAKHVQKSPYPVIIAGDFNDTPISYVYRISRGSLKDAFRESGSGFGGTYNGRLPSFRIDYLFHSPEFDSYNFKVLPLLFSDHFPIMATIDLNQ